jgi:hypothetical protein
MTNILKYEINEAVTTAVLLYYTSVALHVHLGKVCQQQ